MIGKLKAFAAGLVVGILVAPRSGRATRRFIADTLGEFLATGRREYEELEDELDARRGTDAYDERPFDDGDWPRVDESVGGPGA